MATSSAVWARRRERWAKYKAAQAAPQQMYKFHGQIAMVEKAFATEAEAGEYANGFDDKLTAVYEKQIDGQWCKYDSEFDEWVSPDGLRYPAE